MNRKLLVVLAAIASLVMFSGSAMAHHGVAGYDMTKTITVHGTVSKFDWSNPHVVVYVDAKNEAGEMQHWTIEFASPVHMVRAGWSKSSMKTGDDITIDTHPSRNGAPVGISSTITFILKVVVNGQALPSRSE
jgi:Cu/Ag efflux protein CusF